MSFNLLLIEMGSMKKEKKIRSEAIKDIEKIQNQLPDNQDVTITIGRIPSSKDSGFSTSITIYKDGVIFSPPYMREWRDLSRFFFMKYEI